MNVGNVVKNCFSGVYALLCDPAGSIALLVLIIATVLCLKGKIGDISFAAVCGFLPAVIAVLKHRSFSGADIDQCPPSEPIVTPTINPTDTPITSTVMTTAAVGSAAFSVPPAAAITIPLANLPARGTL